MKDDVKVSGVVEIIRVTDRSGAVVPVESVLVDGNAQLGSNLVVDGGRAAIAHLLGGETTGYRISAVSFGTGDEPPRYNDVTLSPQPGGEYTGGENQVELSSGAYNKPIAAVLFPAPYLVQFQFSLDYHEANGFVIREAGLWTEAGVLFARKAFPGIIKSSENRIEMMWTLRS